MARYTKEKIIQCSNCQKEISNKKFCGTKCLKEYCDKNKDFIYKTRKNYYCKCGVLLSVGFLQNRRRTCPDCSKNHVDWQTVSLKDMFAKLPRAQAHARIRSLSRATYFKENKEKSCFCCGYNKHIEVCHIKPIVEFDLNSPISTVNHKDNLVGLCPNCHWELDHKLLTLPVADARVELASSAYETVLEPPPV